jgi:hypothetical protein
MTSRVRSSLSSKVVFNFSSVRSFKSKAAIETANNARGIAMSRVAMNSTSLNEHLFLYPKTHLISIAQQNITREIAR